MSSVVESEYKYLNPTIPVGHCFHCRRKIDGPVNEHFCCTGCSYIYSNIHKLGLSYFYTMQESSSFDSAPVREISNHDRYLAFDDESVLPRKNLGVNSRSQEITLSVDGIFCAGCLWVLEYLPKITPGLTSVRANLTNGIVNIQFDPTIICPSKIATLTDSLGLPLSPIRSNGEVANTIHVERSILLRLAVAAVCTANIMMIAVSLYQGESSGIEVEYVSFFRWLSLLLALPVITFSSQPFFKNSINGIKNRLLHIDLPISIAIILGTLLSFWSTVTNDNAIYFDSISMLVLLLLSGRYLELRARQWARFETKKSWEILPIISRTRKNDGSWQDVATASVNIGEEILIKASERVPFDGVITHGNSSIDISTLTGESLPVSVSPGKEIEAGSLNIEGDLIMRVTQTRFASRIAKILQEIENSPSKSGNFTTLINSIAPRFTGSVLVLAFITLIIWWSAGVDIAIRNAIALLVVTCPCALALATPVTFSIAIARAAKAGLLIRDSATIEKVTASKQFIFDKTGTLTEGVLEVVDSLNQTLDKELLSVLKTIASSSKHPAARAIYKFLPQSSPMIDKQSIQEIPGRGVTLEAQNGSIYRLGSLRWLEENGIKLLTRQVEFIRLAEEKGAAVTAFSKDLELINLFSLSDRVSRETPSLLHWIKNIGKKLLILSGDTIPAVNYFCSRVGMDKSSAIAALYPEEKAEIVRSINNGTVYIGDGINDAIAMREATTAIALRGGIEAALGSSEIYILDGDIGKVKDALIGSIRTVNIVKRNLIFSTIYNIMGGALAMMGLMHPLVAAILMPVSSLTVISHSILSKSFTTDRR